MRIIIKKNEDNSIKIILDGNEIDIISQGDMQTRTDSELSRILARFLSKNVRYTIMDTCFTEAFMEIKNSQGVCEKILVDFPAEGY